MHTRNIAETPRTSTGRAHRQARIIHVEVVICVAIVHTQPRRSTPYPPISVRAPQLSDGGTELVDGGR